MDAGFKISRAGGGLSPAKEDVIIFRTEIIMIISEGIPHVVITGPQREWKCEFVSE